ncbi:hypothetical protein GQ600_27312 [Phytophthora cactorum]|nr:hypothetical protein GQ600_27312 [Phytophthora cactorum]
MAMPSCPQSASRGSVGENKAKKNKLFEFLKGKGEESNGACYSADPVQTLVFVGSKVGATMLAEAIEKRCRIGAGGDSRR